MDSAVVLDIGSFNTKAGMSTSSSPVIIQSVIGRERFPTEMLEFNRNQIVYAGADAIDRLSFLSLKYPVRRGVFENLDDLETLLNTLFEEKLSLKDTFTSFVLSESFLQSKYQKEKITQILFETFDVRSVYFSDQAVLSLQGENETTGLSVYSGHGVSYAVPIIQGYTFPHAIKKTEIAGIDITDYLSKLMTEVGIYFESTADWEIANATKENLSYVALDFQDELRKSHCSNAIEKTFMFPDDTCVTLDTQRFRCPEILFDPSIVCRETAGIVEQAYNAIKACPIDLQRRLFENVSVFGGNSSIPGFVERFQRDLSYLAPSNVQVHVKKGRENSAWYGGKNITQSPLFEKISFNNQDYDEIGPFGVHKKPILV